MNSDEKIKQKQPRYEMHKYWGKKPSKDLKILIGKFSKENDIVLDPFSGYGVFICEAFLMGRNVIGNDLNPAANFILEQLLNTNVDLQMFKKTMCDILDKIKKESDFWYTTICPECKKECSILATLRKKDGTPLVNKLKCACSKNSFTQEFSESMVDELLFKEKNAVIEKHPTTNLIKNSRISAFKDMTTDDLFTTRILYCHSMLYKLIENIDNDDIKNLAKLTFTSNLANCSKLVPPIKSRGAVSPGAWMTGFYVADEYLEQNVFHYFKNRVEKVLQGKSDYFNNLEDLKKCDKNKISSFNSFNDNSLSYLITNDDAKKINLPDNSVDYIFTDPPYGDTVPYFEQSLLWNNWLRNEVNYNNEIVISDSKEREKTIDNFKKDIYSSIKEIHRVLKNDKYFSITYHSISGKEWYALTTACLELGFEIHDFSLLLQKNFSPRQINTKKAVKGDILITFKKIEGKIKTTKINEEQTKKFIKEVVENTLKESAKNTNDIYIILLKEIFMNHILFYEVDFIKELNNYFVIDDNGFWNIK